MFGVPKCQATASGPPSATIGPSRSCEEANASSHVVSTNLPPRRTSGARRRSGSWCKPCNAVPLGQMNPRVGGCSASPRMPTTSPSSTLIRRSARHFADGARGQMFAHASFQNSRPIAASAGIAIRRCSAAGRPGARTSTPLSCTILITTGSGGWPWRVSCPRRVARPTR